MESINASNDSEFTQEGSSLSDKPNDGEQKLEIDGSTPMHEALAKGRLTPIELALLLTDDNF